MENPQLPNIATELAVHVICCCHDSTPLILIRSDKTSGRPGRDSQGEPVLVHHSPPQSSVHSPLSCRCCPCCTSARSIKTECLPSTSPRTSWRIRRIRRSLPGVSSYVPPDRFERSKRMLSCAPWAWRLPWLHVAFS